jgi:hypothetical protein
MSRPHTDHNLPSGGLHESKAVTTKPSLFIASSAEHLDLAYAIQQNLEHDVEATVWTQGVFKISRPALMSLVDALSSFDFGAFVFSPDDVTNMRDDRLQTVRDNVIFELGLFVGGLGLDRSFVIVPRGITELHLPTDLLGLIPATFDPNRQDKNLIAALGSACNEIRGAINRLGRRAAQFQTAHGIPEDKTQTKLGVEMMHEAETKLMAAFGTRRVQRLELPELARMADFPEIKAQHYLTLLTKRDLLFQILNMGGGIHYALTDPGRRYLVDNDLV